MTDHDDAKTLALNALPKHLMLAVIRKEMTLEEAAAEVEFDRRVRALLRQRTAAWPEPSLVWDFDPTRWHRAMDDHNAVRFAQDFPNVITGWVNLKRLEAALAPVSRRTELPTSTKYKSKTARLIVHLEDGGEVTPPLIVHSPTGLFVAGGNHRLGWAIHTGDDEIPILFLQADQAAVENSLEVRIVPSPSRIKSST